MNIAPATFRFARRARVLLGILLLALAGSSTGVVLADSPPWKWPQSFTPRRSPELRALHTRLHGTALAPKGGYPVENLTLETDCASFHLVRGVLYPEAPIEGRSVGAYFLGEAKFSYKPNTRFGQVTLRSHFRKDALEGESISEIYFFSLRPRPLLEELGLQGPPPHPFDVQDRYEWLKAALSLHGMDMTHAFMDRDARAKGTFVALMTLDRIRTARSGNAIVRFAIDPRQEKSVSLDVAGHASLTDHPEFRHFLVGISSCEGNNQWELPAQVDHYDISIRLEGHAPGVEEKATLEMTLAVPTSTLQLWVTPRLQVSQVLVGGEVRPHLQWKWRRSVRKVERNRSIVIDLGRRYEAGEKVTLEIDSEGPLLIPNGLWILADEDSWYPRFNEWALSRYTLRINVPKKYEAIAAGELVEDRIEGDRKHLRYELEKPVWGTSFYFGDFKAETIEENGVEYTSYMDMGLSKWNNQMHHRSAVEMKNAHVFYTDYLGPIDQQRLRLVGTPTGHGRGFSGLVLLSLNGMLLDSSWAQMFQAHEVAHQWWGNLVMPKTWPEDRWLMEATAEYTSMEYFRAVCARDEMMGRFRQRFYEAWFSPLVKKGWQFHYGTLSGNSERRDYVTVLPLGAGGRDSYTRGPAMLHMLRYMIFVTKGSDEPFWQIMREFNSRYLGQRAGTGEFIALCNEALGYDTTWFFDQWLWTPQIPVLEWSKKLRQDSKSWILEIEAAQPVGQPPMNLLVPVHLEFGKDQFIDKTLRVKGGKGKLALRLPAKPSKIELNPEWEALVKLDKR